MEMADILLLHYFSVRLDAFPSLRSSISTQQSLHQFPLLFLFDQVLRHTPSATLPFGQVLTHKHTIADILIYTLNITAKKVLVRKDTNVLPVVFFLFQLVVLVVHELMSNLTVGRQHRVFLASHVNHAHTPVTERVEIIQSLVICQI